jgi:hypothetical protein
MTASNVLTCVGTPLPSSETHHNGFPDLDDIQSISGRNIDPTKLTMLLRVKFGAGAYDIHVSTLKGCERPAKIVTCADRYYR